MKRISALFLAFLILILPVSALAAGSPPAVLNKGIFTFDCSSAYYTPDGGGRASAYELWEFDDKSAAKKGDIENAVLLYSGELRKYRFKSLPDDMRFYAVRSYTVIRKKKYYGCHDDFRRYMRIGSGFNNYWSFASCGLQVEYV